MTIIKPLFDRVLIQPLKTEETTSFGLIIPETAQSTPQEAMVIAVGEGRALPDGTIPAMGVKPGDRVIYSQYSGTKIEYDGKSYILMSIQDLFAVVEA